MAKSDGISEFLDNHPPANSHTETETEGNIQTFDHWLMTTDKQLNGYEMVGNERREKWQEFESATILVASRPPALDAAVHGQHWTWTVLGHLFHYVYSNEREREKKTLK